MGAQGCASRARNPKGPQITPFCHQWGRHPTVLHIRGGVRCRISARISPDRSHPLNLDFFLTMFGPKMPQKLDFRDLYSRFAPSGPCIRQFCPKSSISGICIRGFCPEGPGGPGGPWGSPYLALFGCCVWPCPF